MILGAYRIAHQHSGLSARSYHESPGFGRVSVRCFLALFHSGLLAAPTDHRPRQSRVRTREVYRALELHWLDRENWIRILLYHYT